MLNGIAAAVQRALQTDAVICVTCHFLSPSVSFIHNRLQFLDGQSWLRHQFPVFPKPRPVRHINLDPVRAVVELLASRFPCFHRAIDHLYSFRHFQFRSVSLERIATSRRNCASRDEQAWTRNVSALDRLLDADIAIPRALGFDITQRGETLLQRTTR